MGIKFQFSVLRKTHHSSLPPKARLAEGGITHHFKVNTGFTLIELLVACHPKLQRRKATPGFTLIELLVVMAIFALMVGYASINLIRPQTKASLDTTVTTIVADIKEQQIQAMAGDTASAFGIRFESNRYILFTGSSYPSATSNFPINLDQGLSLDNPNTSVVFTQRSGETTQATYNLTNNNSNEQKTIQINSYGAVTIQ